MNSIPSYSTDIAVKDNAAELVNCRNEALRLWEEAFVLIHEANKMTVRATGSTYNYPNIDSSEMSSIRGGDYKHALASARKNIDTGCWNYMLDAIHLKTFMDATAIKEFQDQLEKNTPEVTMETLTATMDHLSSQRVQIFDRGVITLFTKLDRTFKTNPSFRLDKKIIIKGLMDQYGYARWSAFGAEVRDLDRIFHMLDGKQMPDPSIDACSQVQTARGRPADVETEYFVFKLCANGNLHVTFKRPDLVASVNRIISEHFGPVLGHDRRTRKSA